MARRKLPYKEGDLIQLPIGEAGERGQARGIIARANGKGGLLGYFFLGRSLGLKAKDADLVVLAGDLGLVEGAWKVLWALPGFVRQDWPLPEFARKDMLSGAWQLIRYDEDTLQEIGERRISAKEAARHPEDGDAGYLAVQIQLDMLAQAAASRPLRRAG